MQQTTNVQWSKYVESIEYFKFSNSVHTPLDKQVVLKATKETGTGITVEYHNIICGFGSAVAEVLSEKCPTIVRSIELKDVFGESGDSELLHTHYCMNTEHIVSVAKEMKADRYNEVS